MHTCFSARSKHKNCVPSQKVGAQLSMKYENNQPFGGRPQNAKKRQESQGNEELEVHTSCQKIEAGGSMYVVDTIQDLNFNLGIQAKVAL